MTYLASELMTYTTSNGKKFLLAGGNAIGGYPLLSSPDRSGWEFSRSGGAYYAGERTLDATLAYWSRDQLEECERMATLAELDCLAGTPGTLAVGPWSMRCFLEKGEATAARGDMRVWKVTLRAPDPFWVREHRFQFLPREGAEGIDLPYDLPYDLPSSRADRIESPALGASDFRLTIYGAATSPSVTVGGNAYGATVDVPARARLVIDSTRKRSMAGDSVCLVDEWGASTDVFDRRIRGAEGSGSYVFERIPAGVSEVSRSGNFGFDLTLYERRARLPWT